MENQWDYYRQGWLNLGIIPESLLAIIKFGEATCNRFK